MRKKEEVKFKDFFDRSRVMSLLLIISIMFSSITYAAYNTRLQMQGDAYLRAPGDIRITNVEMVGGSNGASELYVPKFSKNTTSMFVTLPAHSAFQYSVTFTNKDTTNDYIVSALSEISNTASTSGVTYEYELVVNESIIDAPTGGSTEASKEYTITISNDTDTELIETLVLQYTFVELRYTATDLTYYNDLSTKCSGSQTVKCALDELRDLIKN